MSIQSCRKNNEIALFSQ